MTHPGTITYVDGATQAIVATRAVATVPAALRFAGGVAVVRVVATVAGAQRTIREHGPDGRLLRSTVQRR